jgi:hypothetical protein
MAVTAPETDRIDSAPDFAAVRAAGEVVKAFVSSLESERYSGADSVTLITFFTEMERTATAGKTLAAHRVDASNVHLMSGHRSAAELLAAQTGESVGDARQLIRLGESLVRQPELERAFRGGRLSRRRAALVADAAKVNPGKEGELVRGAESDTDATFKERCLRAKAEGRSKLEADRHSRALHEKRYCRTYTDSDGAFRIDALFAPEAGAHLKAALEAQADRQFGRARNEGRFETSDGYRADALLALITGQGILGPKGKAGSSAPRVGSDDAVRTPDASATVSVVVGLEALRRGSVGDGDRCDIPGVGPVPVEYARRHLGEALVELLIAEATDVTTVYSAGRHIPRRVYSALMQRDPRCVVPGCDARLGLENDHWVVDFAKGGLSSMDNIARICHHHHLLRTHDGFRLLGGPGNWQWLPPDNPRVPPRMLRRQRQRQGQGQGQKRTTRTRSPAGTTPERPTPGIGPPAFDAQE